MWEHVTAEVRGTAVVVLVVSHCCISTASKDHIGLSGDQQVNQKRIWTSGIGVKQAVFC